MLKSDFFYDLPQELIAQFPLKQRNASRLLYLSRTTGECQDSYFHQLQQFLKPKDLLVLNNTQVIPARLHGNKATGGKVEILLERCIDHSSALVQIKASKSPKVASLINLDDKISIQIKQRQGEFFQVQTLDASSILKIFQNLGHMPLPPYIQRQDTQTDQQRYQTVYAEKLGAVAAPTAGLHFEQTQLQQLQQQGIQLAYVTLHVGAGTFQTMRCQRIDQHQMHSEYVEVTPNTCKSIQQTQQQGGRVIAVGTTSVRCLETASQSGQLSPYQGETKLFITPGYQFHTIDGLISNFHLPESTLLMLVSAFGGYQAVMQAYQYAVGQKYRFFSYGDAMLII